MITQAAARKFSNEDLTRWKAEINPAPIIGTRIKLRRENAEYVGCCPDVYHVAKTGHSDNHPSFKVYKLDAGVWGFKCFSCGANGNVFQFVQDFDGIKFKDAVAKVLAEAGIEGYATEDQQTAAEQFQPEPEPQKKHVTFTLKEYAPAITAFETATGAHKWLKDRGISVQTAKRFLLGYVQSAEKVTPKNDWMNDGWILFPTLSADGQTVTSVKYRSLVMKKLKRADGSGNSGIIRAPHTSTTMYNMGAVTPNEDIWIVEGEPDTLVMDQAGFNTVGMPMGEHKVSDEECEILSSIPKRRFLAGDNDEIGVKAREFLQKKLRGETFVIRWPNNRKDANDVLTKECGNDADKFKALVESLKSKATQTESEAILIDACDIKQKKIKWLWQDRIPLGKITLFAGNPDNGKSLATTSIAAICTTGGNYPETREYTGQAYDVLMLIGEDDKDDTAVPRLVAAQADLNRIHFLDVMRPLGGDDREVRLDFDIPAIEKQLEKNPAIRLIIIDPISNYLGNVSMMQEQEVRSIMIPLKRTAEKFNVAIVVVMHLNKKADLDAISRVGGAMAFVGVARCSWLFARNVAEETDEGDGSTKPPAPDTFSMLRIKNNLVSSSRAGLSYSVAIRPITIEGVQVPTPYVVWGGVIEGSADDAMGSGSRHRSKSTEVHPGGRPNTILQDACKWLAAELQDGEQHASAELLKKARDAYGISSKTLHKAYHEIGSKKTAKVGNAWFWQVEPMHATTVEEPMPQQSDLISVGGK